MKRLLIALAAFGLATVGRDHLVDLLTKTTGTWVGSPPSRQETRGMNL